MWSTATLKFALTAALSQPGVRADAARLDNQTRLLPISNALRSMTRPWRRNTARRPKIELSMMR
jgi:hypothetical protein